jgi:dihydrodipicolinate synthase/N-acetylneuraminate lyase
MLTARDVRGLLALPPTPAVPDDGWTERGGSVDLVEADRAMRQLVDDGVSSIGLCGTTGEGATLLWEEKEALFRTVVEAVGDRVPVWCGTTALGTREVVRQAKAVRALGGTGVLVGLPMWLTPTLDHAVRFFADLSEALPDLPVLVYANPMFFKFDFGPSFFSGVRAKAPTVVAAKVGFVSEEQVDAAGSAIALLAGEGGSLGALYRMRPDAVRGAWATSAAMGPEPWVELLRAHAGGDEPRALQVLEAIEGVPMGIPDFTGFASFNTAWEKARTEAAGYMRCGPARPPYTDLPTEWREAAEANAKGWTDLRASYRRSGT